MRLLVWLYKSRHLSIAIFEGLFKLLCKGSEEANINKHMFNFIKLDKQLLLAEVKTVRVTKKKEKRKEVEMIITYQTRVAS
jgi:hypothetical protein